jgi:hypothetical protein
MSALLFVARINDFRARTLTNVRVWLSRFIGYPLVGARPPALASF